MYMPHMPAEFAAAAGMATRAYPLSPQPVFPAGVHQVHIGRGSRDRMRGIRVCSKWRR